MSVETGRTCTLQAHCQMLYNIVYIQQGHQIMHKWHVKIYECKHDANELAMLHAVPSHGKASVRLSKQTVWRREATGRAAKLFQTCTVCCHQNTCRGKRSKSIKKATVWHGYECCLDRHSAVNFLLDEHHWHRTPYWLRSACFAQRAPDALGRP